MTTSAEVVDEPAVAGVRGGDRRVEIDRVGVDRVGRGPLITAAVGKDGSLRVEHRFDGDSIDDDLAELLADALQPFTDDSVIFQRAFVGVVATCDRDPDRAWQRFYENSLARVDDRSRTGYVEVHRHALDLLDHRRSVLDLGCSFGFLALTLARRRVRVVAADPSTGTVRLLARMSDRLRAPLAVLCCEGHRVPLPSRTVEAVALLHVLEHLDAAEGDAVLTEALRLADRRVVVAVPYEDRPSAVFGHLRTFSHDELVAIGRRSGWNCSVHDHHGGWLVLDRPEGTAAREGAGVASVPLRAD